MPLEGTEDLVIIIMAGGAGTRFWPVSVQKKPKQFITLFGDQTFIQQSYERAKGLVEPERILVLVHTDYVPLVAEQLTGLPRENIIAEPLRRDTAAAVTLAALLCQKRFGNPVMAILAADHSIEPLESFHANLLSAVRTVRKEDTEIMYTFGVPPTYPATSYGYLERGREIFDDDGIKHYELLRFKEKPDLATARRYLEAGNFYWNSGMFVWTTETIVNQITQFLPDHVTSISRSVEADGSEDWQNALRAGFEPLEAISIDYGVMEKVRNIRCIASTFNWADIGNWLSLEEYLDTDAASNAYRGELEVLDAKRNLVFCENSDELVALIGVNNLVIVRAGKRTLIVDRKRTEEIKRLVAHLREDQC